MANSPKTSPKQQAVVKQLLATATLPRDALPYTEEFGRLKQRFEEASGRSIKDADFWRILARVGKRGGLAQKGARKTAPRVRALTIEEQLEIFRLMPYGLGIRDTLPYTPEFDRLHKQFTRLTRTRFSRSRPASSTRRGSTRKQLDHSGSSCSDS